MISLFIASYLLLAGLFAATHIAALKADLYWYFWWFDIVMHSWGGVLVIYGLAVLRSLPAFSSFLPRAPWSLSLVLFAVMVAWEVFEYGIGTGLRTEFWADTILDIVVGALGGLIAYQLLKGRFNSQYS